MTQSGSTAQAPTMPLATASGTSTEPPVLDLSMVKKYQSMRAVGATGENVYKVTNVFLNVRAEPRAGAASMGRLVQGDTVTVLEFVNATWAKIQMPGGKTGYVALQYLGKLTTDDKLAEDKKAFNNL
ncbi:MAG TPA: SH3 domain-containing protein, partial [Thermodesulfobacteriota bacterium]|nr:SH3 domain-containing protein [Thermodesulfobacteriota bacterium]